MKLVELHAAPSETIIEAVFRAVKNALVSGKPMLLNYKETTAIVYPTETLESVEALIKFVKSNLKPQFQFVKSKKNNVLSDEALLKIIFAKLPALSK